MSVARFIADQRTMHRMPHAVSCAILGVSVSWFYKWVHRKPTPTEVRRSELDAAVRAAFEASNNSRTLASSSARRRCRSVGSRSTHL